MSSSSSKPQPKCNDALLKEMQSIPEQRAVVRTCPKTNTDIELAYQTFGSAANPCILLVMGLNGQLTLWDHNFCKQLADRGFFVVRYDNRDVGLSTKLDKCGTPGLLQLLMPACCCCCGKVPYLLVDMAADGMALLDHLKIQQAHVVGISMGGMLAQTMAIEFPHRVLTMTSIASTTGSPKQQDPSLSMKLFLARKPKSASPHDLSIFQVEFVQRTGGPRPFDEDACYTLGFYTASRTTYREGAFRHAGAIVFSGSREEGLKKLKMPCLVIHGDTDELVPTSNGALTHNSIPGSRFVLVPKMGHILYPEDFELVVTEIVKLATAAAVNEPTRQ